MKTSVKIIIGIALFFVIVCVVAIGAHHRFAHRGMRDMMYATQMNRPRIDFRQMQGMGPGRMGRRGHFLAPVPMPGMRGFMRPGQMFGMRRSMGMRPGPGSRLGRGMRPMYRMNQGPMGPGRMLERIPNLTEKQKKDIADLRQKQQDDMKKLGEEMSAKMTSLRESGRSKMLNLLTDEQKKFLDSNSGNTNSGPSKSK